jgi:hypothetical protein
MLVRRLALYTGEETNHEDARDWQELLQLEYRDKATADARTLLSYSKKLAELNAKQMLEEDFDDALLIMAACHGDYEKARTFLWREAGGDMRPASIVDTPKPTSPLAAVAAAVEEAG